MCNIMKLYDFIRFGNASSSKGLAVLGESGSGRLPLPVSKILIVLLFIIKGIKLGIPAFDPLEEDELSIFGMVADKIIISPQFLDVVHDGDLLLALEKDIEIEIQPGQFQPVLLPCIVGKLFKIPDKIVN